MKQAAAVLVTKGPRILGFLRERDGELGLPCGWLHEGETPAAAAARECQEETGYVVTLDESNPYVGFDPTGKCLVTTFRAEIAGHVPPSHVHEGVPNWIGARTLLDSGYADYNRRALRHFGIAKPLAGKFHSHLTLKATLEEAERARNLVSGKVTIIELERAERQQVDVMLTHHFVAGHKGLEDHHDVMASLAAKAVQLRESGIDVIRVKLEHELLHPKSDPGDVQASLDMSDYTEVHVKLRVVPSKLEQLKTAIPEAGIEGWHPSRNPRQQDEDAAIQFINRRFYGCNNLQKIEEETDRLVAHMVHWAEVLEVKVETAIADDNGELDRWWMA